MSGSPHRSVIPSKDGESDADRGRRRVQGLERAAPLDRQASVAIELGIALIGIGHFQSNATTAMAAVPAPPGDHQIR